MKLDLVRLADYESRVKIIKGSGKSLFQKARLINIEIKNLHGGIFERRKSNDQGKCESRSNDGTGSL